MVSLRTIYALTRSSRLLVCGLAAGVALPAVAQIRPSPRVRRARPPEFSKSIRDAFFPNAQEKLVGPRPEPASQRPVAANPSAGAPAAASSSASVNWAGLIAAETVEDEIKNQQIKLAATVQNATRFKGGDFRQARTNLSVLAAMLAIVAEYDGRIRWKEEAAPLRDQVGQAAQSCSAGTDEAFEQARLRSDDLQLLVRGGSLATAEQAAAADWSQIGIRPALMKRLEQAESQEITPGVASSEEFESNLDQLLHDSRLIAALAEVITREGFEYYDDETYVEYAKGMQRHALSLRDAIRQGDYEQARQAAGELRTSCANCHDGYRS